jgi:cell division septum initiation protein DivIVA
MTEHVDPSELPAATLEELLDAAIEVVSEARTMPMSATIKVNKDELLDLLEDARDAFPEEMLSARRLLRDKEEFLAHARQEREAIIDQGRTQVSRMVERQEIVKAAEFRGQQIVDEARSEAHRLRDQVEDFCDQKLASFEAVLEKTNRTVQQAREKLRGVDIDISGADVPPAPLVADAIGSELR